MGISNSIGSNTFDILLCLGLPWLIKASFLPVKPGHHWVGINSHGLEYSAISLLSTLLMLYVAFTLNKFKLDRKLGHTCLLMYAVFLVLATLIELNVFFRVNLPACIRWAKYIVWNRNIFSSIYVFYYYYFLIVVMSLRSKNQERNQFDAEYIYMNNYIK